MHRHSISCCLGPDGPNKPKTEHLAQSTGSIRNMQGAIRDTKCMLKVIMSVGVGGPKTNTNGLCLLVLSGVGGHQGLFKQPSNERINATSLTQTTLHNNEVRIRVMWVTPISLHINSTRLWRFSIFRPPLHHYFTSNHTHPCLITALITYTHGPRDFLHKLHIKEIFVML